jgi:hypothetical protein
MLRRLNYLLFIGLVAVVAYGLYGCSQKDDVLTPISTTEINLTPERLPALPVGMAYELWVASSQDTASVSKFRYDQEQKDFLDLDGQVISNKFIFHGDINNYRSIFVSVETNPDNDELSPGPIMLIDDVTDPSLDDIFLRFPNMDSLWQSNVRFNMETPSDLNRNADLGCGVWFSNYTRIFTTMPDTLSATWTSSIVTIAEPPSLPVLFPCSLKESYVYHETIQTPGPAYIRMKATPFVHTGIKTSFGYCQVDTAPASGTVWKATFTIGEVKVDTVDFYSNDGNMLPSISKYGWKYKGWAMTPYYNNTVAAGKRWKLTPPAYVYKTSIYNYMPGDTGLIFPTGKFDSLNQTDLSNPYRVSNYIPPFPGEDFINTDSLQEKYGINKLQILPYGSGNVGSIFISLEPDNFIYDTTNFPLFLVFKQIPQARASVTTVALPNTLPVFRMQPRTSTERGDIIGFPTIEVSIKRY